MKIGTAAGSLRYAVLKSGGRVAYCALSISGGTSAEGSRPCGTAHFLEHTLFKGTDRHNASWVAGRLDQLGGELNAYTAKEEIVLHATVLKEDLRTALDLLLELATCPSFPQKEIDVERGVVIDEIRSGKDVPQDEIYDEFEELFFESHPLSRRILGTASSVRSITREHLCSFVRDNFRPDRMAITVVSGQEEDYAEALILKLAQKYFSTPVRGSIPNPSTDPGVAPGPGLGTAPGVAPSAGFAPSASVSVFSKTVSRRYHEACIVIGAQAPSLFSGKERTVAALLANILGGPATNSLLNLYLREKKGWVYGIECSYTQYSSTGVMAILIGCEHSNVDSCISATKKIIGSLIDKPMSEGKLKAAKRQFLGQMGIAADNGESLCLSMGKSLLAFGKVSTLQQNVEAVESITVSDIQEMARRIFSPEKISTLIYR